MFYFLKSKIGRTFSKLIVQVEKHHCSTREILSWCLSKKLR